MENVIVLQWMPLKVTVSRCSGVLNVDFGTYNEDSKYIVRFSFLVSSSFIKVLSKVKVISSE